MERNQVGRTLWVLPLLLLLLLLPGCLAIRGPRRVSGPDRGSVNVTCSYDSGWQNYVKWWCRGSNWGSCNILIKTTGSEKKVTNGRMSIQDNHQRRQFSVTIEDLRMNDEDEYWCGIEKSGTDLGSRVYVSVYPGKPCTPTPEETQTLAIPTTFLPDSETSAFSTDLVAISTVTPETTAKDQPGTTESVTTGTTEPGTKDTAASGTRDMAKDETAATEVWLNALDPETQDTNSTVTVFNPLVKVLLCNMDFLLLTFMKVPLLTVLLCSLLCLKRRLRASREKQSQLEQEHYVSQALDTEWPPEIYQELDIDCYFTKGEHSC